MSRNPFGWDLPPGCTNADIDRAMGAYMDECPECGGGGTVNYGEGDQPCERCNGSGEIDTKAEKAQHRLNAEEARADEQEERRKDAHDSRI